MDKWFTDKLFADMLLYKDGICYSNSNEVPGVSYNDECHDSLYRLEDDSYWFKHRNNVILSAVKKYPPKNNRIIELGAGNGNTAYYLSKNGYQTAIIEPGQRGCINASKRGVANVLCALMNKEIVKINTVEAIGLFDVLEHIEEDVTFLQEICELLQNDGLLYITVPAHKCLWSSSDETHYRRYSRKLIYKTVEESGYSVLYDTYFFWFLPIPITLFRVIPYILWEKKRAKKAINAEKGNTKDIKENLFKMPPLIDKVINTLLVGELKCIDKGKRTNVGASILLVAKKI